MHRFQPGLPVLSNTESEVKFMKWLYGRNASRQLTVGHQDEGRYGSSSPIAIHDERRQFIIRELP
jgi:hypothetical protein